jgi:hypothetical protein
MIFDRITWIGLMIVALGWSLLLSATQLTDLVAGLSGRVGTARLDVVGIAHCAVLSGFGIAILGALQTGFGALNRFFEAVLTRTGASAPKPTSIQAPRQKKILERGWVKDRAYVLFTDGSVEVETMLGRRNFPSLKDAQEFIA